MYVTWNDRDFDFVRDYLSPDWYLRGVLGIEQDNANMIFWVLAGTLVTTGNEMVVSGIMLNRLDEDGLIFETRNFFDLLPFGVYPDLLEEMMPWAEAPDRSYELLVETE